MFIKLKISLLVSTCLLLTNCDIATQADNTATVLPLAFTETMPATVTLPPPNTPIPLSPQPTISPLEGITATQLNVRAEPSTASEVLGIIAANSTVQITGKDIGGNWWQIIYDAEVDRKGWVTAQYVETGTSLQVPVIGDGENSQPGNTAVVIQQINIRSGPGTNFNSLGILNANDIVNLTGKNPGGSWLQIDFAAGPEEKGWVNSGFVKTDMLPGLPIISDEGNTLGTGTPVNTPLPSTPTLVPAPMDFDTAENPIKTVILGGVGPHSVLYNGDVSFPEGDTEDWISVTPQENVLFVDIRCLGSEMIKIEIVRKTVDLLCNGSTQAIPVEANSALLIHIQATGSTNELQYTKYILNIKVSP